MAEQKEYYIKVEGTLVQVTESVYITYYKMSRHAKYLQEKDEFHGLLRYSEWDTNELVGEDALSDTESLSVEETAIYEILQRQLYQGLQLLSAAEYKMIQALYFEGLSERQYMERTGIPQKTINERKIRTLAKLKKFLENKK